MTEHTLTERSPEDRLVAAYDQGLLVLFLGAGMSAPACPLWEPFVTRLERHAGIEPARNDHHFIERTARASRRVRQDPSKTR